MTKFIGFMIVMLLLILGFWGIIFFSFIAPIWLIKWIIFKLNKKNTQIINKILPEKENIKLLFKK